MRNAFKMLIVYRLRAFYLKINTLKFGLYQFFTKYNQHIDIKYTDVARFLSPEFFGLVSENYIFAIGVYNYFIFAINFSC